MEEAIRAELQALRDQNAQLAGAVAMLQQQQQTTTEVTQALASLPQTLAALPQTLASAVRESGHKEATRKTMVDIKGLGKPPMLINPSSDFITWARKTENFVASVYAGAREVLAWSVEQTSSVSAKRAIDEDG
eukprot:6467608-Amphidinium_carterae.1